MQSGLRAAVLALWAKFLKKRPDFPKVHGDGSKTPEGATPHGQQPEQDVLQAEWAAFQTLIGEIHKSDKEHHTAEQNLGAAQHRTAKGLNWITGIGAVFGAVASV